MMVDKLFVIAVLVFFPVAAGIGQEDCTDPHNQCGHDDGAAGGTTVQTTVEGSSSKSLALGFGLGGSDIGDCLVTTQLGIIIFHHQGSKSNPWCRWRVAQALDDQGKHHDAAKIRCTIKDIYEIYGREASDECIKVYTFDTQSPAPDLGQLYDQAARATAPDEAQQREEMRAYVDEQVERIERSNTAEVARKRQQRAEDSAYLRGLADELKELDQRLEAAGDE